MLNAIILWTSIFSVTLAGSRCDPGKILAAGSFLPGGNLARIPTRFSLGNEIPGGQNLARILPQISPRFSPRSKNPDGQNLNAILLPISPRFSPGSNNSGSQNLAGMLPQISPRFSPMSKFTVAKISARSCWESRQDLQKSQQNFRHHFTSLVPWCQGDA